MDRRQRKSREAISPAFSALLKHKRYEQITVQDITEDADVGCSTFYAHFETKDMLLHAMCSDILDHIFAGDLCDYAAQNHTLPSHLAHILRHLSLRNENVTGILACDSGELFLSCFRERLNTLFTLYLADFSAEVPADFLLNHLVGSFTEAVRWWVRGGMTLTPETVAAYYMNTLQ